MFANPQIEQMARDSLRKLQEEKLKKELRWVQEKSAFYQSHFAAAGVDIKEIETLDDIRKLPFLTNVDLYKTDSFDMLTMPISSVLRFAHLQEQSGALLKLYTNGDIGHNVEMVARMLVSTGVNQTSVVGIVGDMADTRFMDIQYALELLGAAVVAFGADSRQWLPIMEHMTVDSIVAAPQMVLQLIIQMQAAGKNIVDYPLARVICVNPNAIQNPMQRHIYERTKAEVYNVYAPAPIGMGGMLCPCEARTGQHLQEDHFYGELIAFNSDEPVTDPHQMGELVITTLDAEAMPLIRYRTGQAVSFDDTPCKCGRTLRRVLTPFSFI